MTRSIKKCSFRESNHKCSQQATHFVHNIEKPKINKKHKIYRCGDCDHRLYEGMVSLYVPKGQTEYIEEHSKVVYFMRLFEPFPDLHIVPTQWHLEFL